MNSYYNIQEEELKIRIAEQFFASYDCDSRIGKIDFCVVQKQKANANIQEQETVSLLWAEAKRDLVTEIYKPLVQLILTIGKARTFETYLPPPFLAAFDAEKIAFIPYKDILPFFALNDFNWNITPSDDTTREFGLLYSAVRDTLERSSYIFYYDVHEAELREFIKQHIKIPNKPLPRVTNHRERKGSFFTPKIWVDLSQKYLADVLGENWQDEYYVWDCAAGTSNLLNGLTNKYNIWASTLDQQDVDVMKERIKNGANLLESHVFQFDFLNDSLTKLPENLQKVLNDPKKQSKLIIYINPPYAEAGNARTRTGGRNKSRVATTTKVRERYGKELGLAIRELFAQFMIRAKKELPTCKIALFSTAKYLQGAGFEDFHNVFLASFHGGFVVPAYTFDNVKGNFPIAFAIWDLNESQKLGRTYFDVYETDNSKPLKQKSFGALPAKRITDWITAFKPSEAELVIGYTGNHGPDFQNNRMLQLINRSVSHANGTLSNATKYTISARNLLPICIYFSVRLCLAQTWLNDRDQFLSPHADWIGDAVFQNNCLTFVLFSPKNNIQSALGTNYWLPFTEHEVEANNEFDSHFMTDFIAGRCPQRQKTKDERQKAQSEEEKKSKKEVGSLRNLTEGESFVPTEPLEFSPEATAVFDAGRELWRYYHAQPNANPNASYYDIREHFQGRNKNGRMNPMSDDMEYMRLLGNLKEAMEVLRQQIVPKVYEYGFLI